VQGASSLIFIILMFAVFYFLLIRPQVKRQKEHQSMLNALQKGEMVITRGGLIGKITGITNNILTLELQEKVRVRVVRTHVDGKYDPAQYEAKGGETSSKAA
jgi:preprotein translocase subunit YajC